MKYSCEMIRDLMPLYCDHVCSVDSQKAVEEHMQTCEGCRDYYARMSKTSEVSPSINGNGYEQQQIASIKKVRKKWQKKNRTVGVIGLAIGILLAFAVGAVALFWVITGSRIELVHDAGQYQDCIGESAKEPYRSKWGMDESIFPKAITEEMEKTDFQFLYYDPWDAQYVAYLEVEYTAEGYEEELRRLGGKGIGEYIGYYGVTGEPDGYELLAMYSDAAYGFVYAITPKEAGTKIVYVEIIFCNYFLDVNIRKYVPEEFLLKGFDAGTGNPYRRKMLKGR